jgi:hypothetical protein
MLKRLTLQDGQGALGLSSHTVSIERINKDGKWTDLPVMGSVRPQDAVRYSAHFSRTLMADSAAFWVTNSAGQLVWGDPEEFHKEFGVAIGLGGGSAWVDATAPAVPGVYILHVNEKRNPDHVIQRTFKVDTNAPAPPSSPGGGLDIQKIPWWVWIVLSLIVVVGVGVVL